MFVLFAPKMVLPCTPQLIETPRLYCADEFLCIQLTVPIFHCHLKLPEGKSNIELMKTPDGDHFISRKIIIKVLQVNRRWTGGENTSKNIQDITFIKWGAKELLGVSQHDSWWQMLDAPFTQLPGPPVLLLPSSKPTKHPSRNLGLVGVLHMYRTM